MFIETMFACSSGYHQTQARQEGKMDGGRQFETQQQRNNCMDSERTEKNCNWKSQQVNDINKPKAVCNYLYCQQFKTI
jgi:hypothetical protein